MILLYSFVLGLLGGVKFVLARRANSLGRAYSALSQAVQKRLKASNHKPGNAAFDPCALAKNQFELGVLVQKRDRAEAKHFAWQARAEKVGRWLEGLRSWKGRKLPYTLGVVDVWLALAAVDQLGVGEFVSARRLYDLVVTLLAQQ